MMVITMIDITKATTVFIGRRGEHHFRNIEFDVSSMLGEAYPNEALNAIFKRPDGTAYPVVTTYADEILTWSPSSTDTIDAGVGRLEIRVVYGDVVGKSVSVLTIIEEALIDGGTSPPEPPAQEWVNQVLTALAAIDVNDTYALLNLTYNMLEETRDKLYKRSALLLNHLHPIETATAPDMVSRRAAITFTNIVVGNTVTIGSVTYSFVASLGSPSENNVQVLIQDTLRNTVKKLAEAIRGTEDEANIAYGAGIEANPTCTAYWTSQRFSIGDATIVAGESLFMLEKAANEIFPITLSSTAATTINGFTRAAYSRYILSGNTVGAGGANSVRGPLQTILPIDSVVIGGQGGLLYPATYDCHLITLCRQSDTTEKELDFYISNDEETFTNIQRSTPIGSNASAESLHIHIQMRQARIPAGYGLYIRMGSDGTSSSAYCDLKFTYHLYPAELTTTDCDGL